MSDPITVDVPVRFSDLDAAGIVNNAVYATYLEEARVAFLLRRLEADSLEELPIVVASLQLDYEHPIPDMTTVSVTVECTDLGESSFTMAYDLAVGGATVATAETVQVIVDRETGTPRELPDWWRDRLTRTRDD